MFEKNKMKVDVLKVVAEFEKPTKCEDCPCFYKTEGAFNDE